MLRAATILACAYVVSANYVYHPQGETCKQDNGPLWTCTTADKCPSAWRKRLMGIELGVCNRERQLICCEPEVRSSLEETISQRMCKKYAEAVFKHLPPDPFGGEQKVDTCVAVEPLIYGGQDTLPKEFPHMARLGSGREDNITWLCSGSLISERFVLSAAHCKPNQSSRGNTVRWVQLGEHRVASNEETAAVYEIQERINHPQWRACSDNIALYRLKMEVKFSESMRPACLNTGYRPPKTYAIATGWARTERGVSIDILQKDNFTLYSRNECNRPSRGERQTAELAKDAKEICAGPVIRRSTLTDLYYGIETRGLLQLRLTEPYCMYSVIGITSFGPRNCGASTLPGVYTRVSHYVPWIESIVWPEGSATTSRAAQV